MTERDLGLAIEQLCKYLGVRYYHAWSSQHSVPGWPDYVFIRKDFTLLIRELKSARGRLTAHQEGWLDALTKGGHDANTWRPCDLASGRILAELKGVRNLEGCS